MANNIAILNTYKLIFEAIKTLSLSGPERKVCLRYNSYVMLGGQKVQVFRGKRLYMTRGRLKDDIDKLLQLIKENQDNLVRYGLINADSRSARSLTLAQAGKFALYGKFLLLLDLFFSIFISDPESFKEVYKFLDHSEYSASNHEPNQHRIFFCGIFCKDIIGQRQPGKLSTAYLDSIDQLLPRIQPQYLLKRQLLEALHQAILEYTEYRYGESEGTFLKKSRTKWKGIAIIAEEGDSVEVKLKPEIKKLPLDGLISCINNCLTRFQRERGRFRSVLSTMRVPSISRSTVFLRNKMNELRDEIRIIESVAPSPRDEASPSDPFQIALRNRQVCMGSAELISISSQLIQLPERYAFYNKVDLIIASLNAQRARTSDYLTSWRRNHTLSRNRIGLIDRTIDRLKANKTETEVNTVIQAAITENRAIYQRDKRFIDGAGSLAPLLLRLIIDPVSAIDMSPRAVAARNSAARAMARPVAVPRRARVASNVSDDSADWGEGGGGGDGFVPHDERMPGPGRPRLSSDDDLVYTGPAHAGVAPGAGTREAQFRPRSRVVLNEEDFMGLSGIGYEDDVSGAPARSRSRGSSVSSAEGYAAAAGPGAVVTRPRSSAMDEAGLNIGDYDVDASSVGPELSSVRGVAHLAAASARRAETKAASGYYSSHLERRRRRLAEEASQQSRAAHVARREADRAEAARRQAEAEAIRQRNASGYQSLRGRSEARSEAARRAEADRVAAAHAEAQRAEAQRIAEANRLRRTRYTETPEARAAREREERIAATKAAVRG